MNAHATVKEARIPEGTVIHAHLPGAQFFDAYEVTDPHPEHSALQTWLDVVARTPQWTQHLMTARNKLVRLVGLKDLGQLHDAHSTASGLPPKDARSYREGDRVGIFLIRHLSDTEVVMGQDDKHLDVQVSLAKRTPTGKNPTLVVSTVVHIHNALGHAYMAIVTPFHRRIVRAMLHRVAAPGHGQR